MRLLAEPKDKAMRPVRKERDMSQSKNRDYPYEDIIGLPHHVSSTRPPMPVRDRAAQFSPFSALSGYDSVVKEAARITDSRAEMDENEVEHLNAQLQMLLFHLEEEPEAVFTYFKPDEKKSGGSYVTVFGTVAAIDPIAKCVLLSDGTSILMETLREIQIRPKKT